MKPKDFGQHAELCNALMNHYNIQWQNRQRYWQARTRSMVERDLLCAIIDSYDKSKLLLPTWPLKRCPKKTVYELHQRLWDSDFWKLSCQKRFFNSNISSFLLLVPRVSLQVDPAWSRGVSLTLTCVIMHGHGCYLYLCDESYSAGSSWQWECAAWQ